MSVPDPFPGDFAIGIHSRERKESWQQQLMSAEFPDRLRLEDYFLGETTGWGMFRDRYGNLRQEFRVLATGVWRGDHLALHEEFIYRDGSHQQRTWRITPTGEGQYQGSAEDIVGLASGLISGQSCSWQYRLKVITGNREVVLKFDDCLHLMPNGCLLGHARVSKLGFHIGDVMLCFQRMPHHLFCADHQDIS